MIKYVRTKRIGDICLVTDYVANGSFASLRANVKYNYSKDFAILVRTTDFTKKWGKGFVYVSEASYNFLKKSKLFEGDVIISNVGEPGVTFKVPDLGQPMTLGPNAILIRSLDYSILLQDYLYHLFLSPAGQRMIEGITSGTTQKKFNKTNFRDLELKLPAVDDQKRIIDLLDKMQEFKKEYILNIEKQLLSIRELENSISINALIGES